MRKIRTVIVALAVLSLAVLSLGLTGKSRNTGAGNPAVDVSSFFDGATVRLIVPHAPGGGYDLYARLLAPYLAKYSGARVKLVHLHGAGGMRGASEIFRSPPDGLTIGIVNGSGMATSRIAGAEGADYDIASLSLLGRIARDARVLSVSAEGAFPDFDRLLASPEKFRIGATGLGGSTYVDAVVTRDVFALNADVVHGFDNTADMRLALLRGSVDGFWSSWDSARGSVESGHSRAIVQGGRVRADDLPDVPSVFEFIARTADSAQAATVLEAWDSLNEVGRVLVAPPGLDPETLAFLRNAFRAATSDPGLLEEAAQAGRSLAFLPGEETEDLVAAALDMPQGARRAFAAAHRSGLQ